MNRCLPLALWLLAAAPVAAGGETPDAWFRAPAEWRAPGTVSAGRGEGVAGPGIRSRLRAGLRARAGMSLRDGGRTEDNAFMGTIGRLEARKEYKPVLPVLRCELHPQVHLEGSYEALSTRTGTFEGDSDGRFKLNGPALGLLFRHPNTSRFTPCLGIGWIYYRARFHPESRWNNGFPGSDSGLARHREWMEQGRPEWPNSGYQRWLVAESRTLGTVLSGSLEMALDDHWHMEVFGRYVRAEARARFTLRSYGEVFRDRGDFSFPHDHTAFGLGLFRRF